MRKKLLEQGLLDISLKVRREGDAILFPVRTAEASNLGYEVAEEEFEGRELVVSDYKGLAQVPEGLRPLLPTSFDVVGDVAMVKLPDELLPYAQEVGRALMATFPRLATVALDKGVKGQFRVRDLEVLAGGPGTETVHTEYGVRLHADPSKAYFNPRLSNERYRIATLVGAGERVIDMFAGVGPFSIMVARWASPEVVYALDLNPEAMELLKRNIQLNGASNVVPILGDAREVIYDLPSADRIIMNLPHSAADFFHDALARLNMEGTIHIYHICERGQVQDLLDRLMEEARASGKRVELTRLEELKTYSPSMSVYALDLLLAGWL